MKLAPSANRKRLVSFALLDAGPIWLVLGLILFGLCLNMSSARAQDSQASNGSLASLAYASTSLGDLDGDSNLDLVVTGNDVNKNPVTKVYLGDGSGGFSEVGTDLTGTTGGSALGDIDGDGKLDLVVSGFDGSGPSTTVYLGDGSGGFSKAGAGLAGLIGSLSLGDLNGDDNLDLVLTGRAKGSPGSNPTAKVYLGDGNGGFSEADTDLTGVTRGSTSLGDIDGDNKLDLVVTGHDGSGPSARVYLGNGSGGFTKVGAGVTGVMESSSSLGDLNGDGNLDLVATGNDGNGSSTKVYLGDGSGEFSEAEAGLTSVDQSSTSLGDIDGDGDLDLVVAGYGNGPSTTVYLGDGNGGFSKAGAGLVGVFNGSTSLGDLDGDGNLDLVIVGNDGNYTRAAKVYLGDGNGRFSEAGND